MTIRLYIYIYIYRERERERERDTDSSKGGKIGHGPWTRHDTTRN